MHSQLNRPLRFRPVRTLRHGLAVALAAVALRHQLEPGAVIIAGGLWYGTRAR